MTTENSRADALTDLLPCPFCGGEANHIQGFKPLDDAHFIDCATCGVSSKVFDTKETAFAAWNLRAASPASQPAAAPIARNDPNAVTRLKAICRKLGLESAFPDEVYSDPEGLFVIFGRVREAIDRMVQPAPSPADERAAPEVPEKRDATDPEEQWQQFWKEICTNDDGSINLEQVKKELSDFSMLLSWVPRVYMHVTGGKVSKVNTWPSVVTSLHDERVEELVEEALQSERDDCAASASATGAEAVAWQVRRADGRIDGVPIQWENCTKDLYDATLSTGRYAGYENGPRCEVRALYAAPQPAQADARGEDAYVAKRLSEVLASVYATLIGDDQVDENDGLNAIQRCERAAQVLRLEVELYRGQADARVGLTDEQILECATRRVPPREVPKIPELAFSRSQFVDVVRALLASHPGQPEPRAEVTDTARLDWMIAQQAWIQWTVRDGSIRQCQVYDQDEDENYHILSGDDRYFDTPREAIDAARAGEKQ
ncbi:Lar family restriction alleviation protein [Burkholderia vietnamiensis]|uniref:Restriction alleviation protein Lar n=1 Tax=Burkholderia vietnamiensis (strain G4 / LMG 22486) TaxID=269482 RepID=A4JD09_BURVG|nr:Lar family restriction alleviation protein [Burkholderia vietnamiensis]ABO54162.1 hypothetical protein Bcep1808_1151 [Burkholderia vietnamiensis G4]MCB4347289.1 Lar family restriction alleviation protein [Burkholderia vietnamiensis]